MKKILVILCIIAIIATTAIMFVGCDKKSEDLSKKPLTSSGGGGSAEEPWYIRYKAPQSVFPIDDVRLTVACGGQFPEWCEAESLNVQSFRVTEDWETWKKIENKSEVFPNPDFQYCAANLIGANMWVCETEMFYEEELVFPREVFTHDKGVIVFYFMVIDNFPYIRNYPYPPIPDIDTIVVDSTFDTGKESECITVADVLYEVHGDTVILFN